MVAADIVPGDVVIAEFDYTAGSERELSFRKEEVFRVLSRTDSGWLLAEVPPPASALSVCLCIKLCRTVRANRG